MFSFHRINRSSEAILILKTRHQFNEIIFVLNLLESEYNCGSTTTCFCYIVRFIDRDGKSYCDILLRQKILVNNSKIILQSKTKLIYIIDRYF